MIVIPFPVLDGLDQEPYPYADYIKAVCDAALGEGAECLDVAPALKDTAIRLTVSQVENHPSADVLAQVAETLAAIIED